MEADTEASLDANRLVFVDETGTSTKMVRTHGRCRRGQRLIGKAPAGHWKTTTFTAGLRCDGLAAPFVLEGPMNGESFLIYVETVLAPSLSQGDIVVNDNLSAHKQGRFWSCPDTIPKSSGDSQTVAAATANRTCVIAIEPKMIDRILTVGGFTLLSRVTGFVRDIMLAAILGAGPVADAFFVALRLPNHFRAIFGEGAFNAAFVPAYARIREANGAEPSQLFADRIFTLLLVVQIVLLAAALAFMPAVIGVLAPGFNADPGRFAMATELTRITFPYLLLISLVTLYSGILNALGRFATPAAAPILLNLSIMMTLALAAFFPTAGHAAAWGVLIAGVLEVILVAGDAWKRDALPKLRWPRLDLEMKGFLKRFGPATVGSAETQIALFADTIIASFLVAGSLSALYYADRLNQLPDRRDRHRRRHRAAARDGAAHRGRRRGWRAPFAEPRRRTDSAACGALHGGVPDRAGIDHARVVRPRRLHCCQRAGGRRHACGLCARSSAVRLDAQRDRDVPFARRHHHAGQGAVRRGRRQCRV